MIKGYLVQVHINDKTTEDFFFGANEERKAKAKLEEIKENGWINVELIPLIAFPKVSPYGYEISKDVKRVKRAFDARLKYGFDESEIWDLRSTFARFVVPRLKQYRGTGCITFECARINPDEAYWPEYDFEFCQVIWDSIIDRMIDAFQLEIDGLSEDKEYKDRFRIGLELFQEYYLSLWN